MLAKIKIIVYNECIEKYTQANTRTEYSSIPRKDRYREEGVL